MHNARSALEWEKLPNWTQNFLRDSLDHLLPVQLAGASAELLLLDAVPLPHLLPLEPEPEPERQSLYWLSTSLHGAV